MPKSLEIGNGDELFCFPFLISFFYFSSDYGFELKAHMNFVLLDCRGRKREGNRSASGRNQGKIQKKRENDAF